MAREHTSAQHRNRKYFRGLALPCAICGSPIDYSIPYPAPASFVVDHILPITLGGTDARSNQQPAHRACNSRKGGRAVAPIIRRSGSLNMGGVPQ